MLCTRDNFFVVKIGFYGKCDMIPTYSDKKELSDPRGNATFFSFSIFFSPRHVIFFSRNRERMQVQNFGLQSHSSTLVSIDKCPGIPRPIDPHLAPCLLKPCPKNDSCSAKMKIREGERERERAIELSSF